MAKLTISSKNQVTMPVDFIRALGLKGGDRLDAELIDGRIVLWPEPDSYADTFIGSLGALRGYVEGIDRHMAEERASWHESEQDAKAQAFLRADTSVSNAARDIVDHLRGHHGGAVSRQDLARAVDDRLLWPALRRLIELGVAEDIPEPDRDGEPVGAKYQLSKRYSAGDSASKR